MKYVIIFAGCMVAAVAQAATSPQDCGVLYRPGNKVVTPEGTGILQSCEQILVKYTDGAIKTPQEILPIMRPIPVDAPLWYGRQLNPNFEPRQK